jgi:hypothetical protein
MQIDIHKPNFSLRKDDYHYGKFITVVILVIAAVVAGYQGWILIPDVDTVGGLGGLVLALIAIVAVVLAVNTESKAWRNVAIIAAFIAGMIAQPVWKGLSDFVTTLSWGQVAGLLIGIFVTVVVGAWCAKR